MNSTLAIVLMGVVGLCVGSIVTMVVDRVPDRLPLFRPGPRCPLCEERIAPMDLVPVLSWLALRGRCRACHQRFTAAYPAVEIACGAAFAAATWRLSLDLALVPYLLFFATLIAVSTVDLYEYIIPNRILFPALGLSVALVVALSLYYGEPERIGWALCGMFVFGLVLGLPALIRPAKLGLGDAKLALLMGLNLGWLVDYLNGVRLILYSLVIGCLFGVVSGLALWAARRITGKQLLADPEARLDEDHAVDDEQAPLKGEGLLSMPFPFGPALALGSMLGVLFWKPLLGL